MTAVKSGEVKADPAASTTAAAATRDLAEAPLPPSAEVLVPAASSANVEAASLNTIAFSRRKGRKTRKGNERERVTLPSTSTIFELLHYWQTRDKTKATKGKKFSLRRENAPGSSHCSFRDAAFAASRGAAESLVSEGS